MKKLIRVGFLRTYILSICVLLISSSRAININGSLNSGGILRTFILHASGSNVGQDLPVVIIMHGDGSNGAGIESYCGFDAVADAQNFIAVYPDAVNGTWNRYADNVSGDAGLGNPNAPDDVLFISDLIDYLCSSYGINKNKVYATGHSAGGFMAYNLSLQLPNKIAAFAPVSASLWGNQNFITQKLGSNFIKVPIYHIHGDADGTVDYPDADHTPGAWSEWPLDGYSYPDCGKDTYLPSDVTSIIAGSIQKIQFCSNGAGSKEVSLIRIIGGTHAWPSVNGFNCAQSIYDFCKTYSLNIGSCTAPNSISELNKTEYTLFPNPSSSNITITISENMKGGKINITNITGSVIVEKEMMNEKETISVTGFAKGIYLVNVINNNQKTTQKLIIE